MSGGPSLVVVTEKGRTVVVVVGSDGQEKGRFASGKKKPAASTKPVPPSA